MIKILHVADIHLGSGYSHGKINPATGLNTRLEDFGRTLGLCLDRAIAEPVDLVLFGGDAFPDATPPPVVQEAFARQFRRLVDAQIPTVLLVGNHDQHSQGAGGASLCIYRTLGVPGFIVGDRLETHRVATRSGPIQIVTLPWLTRSALLTRPETEGLSLAEVSQLLVDRLRVALEGEIRRLDPDCPAVLLAHVMTDTARYGAERFLAVGKGFTVPLQILARPCFNYVALGHVHTHQILCEAPLTIYPGSIERVDFSEEGEPKGYVLVTIDPPDTQAEFCPLPARPFRTIRADVSATPDPQTTLLAAIAQTEIEGAVVRLLYKLRPEQVEQIDTAALQTALAAAHTYTIHPELVSQLSRSRLPELQAGHHVDPLEALQTYLTNRADLADIAAPLLQVAEQLLATLDDRDRTGGPLDLEGDDNPGQAEPEPASQQLRLL